MKILNGPFSCCHEQMEKLLEAFSRWNRRPTYPREKREYFVHKYIKILAKRKRGNKFPQRSKREIGQDSQRQGKKQKRKQIQGLMKPMLAEYLKRKKRKLDHEYVIFYRRGNYLIEGKASPINRSIIPHISFIPSSRDLRASLSSLADPLSLSLFNFVLLFWHLGPHLT